MIFRSCNSKRQKRGFFLKNRKSRKSRVFFQKQEKAGKVVFFSKNRNSRKKKIDFFLKA